MRNQTGNNDRKFFLQLVLLTALLMLIVGCSEEESGQPSELITPSPYQSLSSTSQLKKTSTPIPAPTETIVVQNTEEPLWTTPETDYFLDDSIHVVMDKIPLIGEWSPIEDQIAFLGCDEESIYQLSLHKPPSFERVVIYSREMECEPNYYDSSWRPDGSLIVFNNYFSSWTSETWVTDLYNYWPLVEDDQIDRFTSYKGWMDNNIFIEGSYSGGGNWNVRFRDVVSSQDTGRASYEGSAFKSNDKYLPVVVSPPGVRVYTHALTRYAKYGPYSPFSEGYKSFPLISFTVNSEFMDWRNRTQYMLLRVVETDLEDRNPLSSRLVFWNVDTDDMPLSIPDSVYGRVSPDGRWLVYMPVLSSEFDMSLDECNPGNAELMIMDLWDQEVKTSFLADYSCDWPANIRFQPLFSFSPDGSKLAYFYTEKDKSNSPATTKVFVIDLINRNLISELNAIELSWSPNGQFVIVKGSESEYIMHDLYSGKSETLIKSSWEYGPQFLWSPSSVYIAIRRSIYTGPPETMIVKNPLLE